MRVHLDVPLTGQPSPKLIGCSTLWSEFESSLDQSAAHVSLRYIDGNGNTATRYPLNPNGSPDGITGLTSRDGRATILMPHPERTLRTANLSWAPAEWGDDSPWMRMFRNARVWVG